MSHDDAVREARERRFALHQAMLDLEHSVQSPSATPKWREELATELSDLASAWSSHVETVEGPEGIIEQAVLRAPRTAAKGDRLKNDHPVLGEKLDVVIDLVDAADDLTDDLVLDIRDGVAELLVGLYRHRAQGSDFVWEAYDLEIGGLG